jgi:hypothetical protein
MKLQTKALLLEITPKLDKNSNSFYRLKLAGSPDYFYAFATDYNLKETTLKKLQENSQKLLNQLTLITYEELPNKDNPGNFKKVKEIQLL